MRIAVLGPTHPYKGGIAQHTTHLAHFLSRQGHNVDLVSWRAQYPQWLYPGDQHVPGQVPEGQPFSSTRFALDWRRPDGWWLAGRRLRAHDAVVVVHVTPIQIPAYLIVLKGATWRVASCPRLVALVHNVLPHESRPGDRMLVRKLLQSVDGVLVHSTSEEMRARSLGAGTTTVAELAPLLNAATLRPSEEEVRSPRRRLLFFGIVRPYKGLDILLQALTRVHDVRLVVAGEFWGGIEQTERKVQELGLAQRVQLRPGYVPADTVPQLFSEVDALILPYRAATSSGIVSLAFAHGVPVVASSVGDIPNRVQHDVDGLLVPAEDPVGLAKALCHLYEPCVLDRLRSGVRQPDFDEMWRTYVGALEGLIAQAADN